MVSQRLRTVLLLHQSNDTHDPGHLTPLSVGCDVLTTPPLAPPPHPDVHDRAYRAVNS